MLHSKLFRLSVICCLTGLQAFSQGQTLGGGSTDSKLGASGNNVSIGSLFSPSLYNGTANISIPIYSFGAYGISLNYNTAGIKVNELSGPAGLHWEVLGEGSIVRKMKDMPDEFNTNAGSSLGGGYGGTIYSSGIKGKFARYFGIQPFAENPYRYEDNESDDFIFSAGGLSFTFNLGVDGFVFTHPHANIKIEVLADGNPVTKMPLQSNRNLSFRVRDADGNQYYFIEGDVSSQTISDGMQNNASDVMTVEYISKWVIQKIVQSDGSEIHYQYRADSYLGGKLWYNAFSNVEKTGAPQIPSPQALRTNLSVASKHIASIQYPNGVTASFIYRSMARCDEKDSILQEIRISESGHCLRYVMKQVYSVTGPNPDPARPITSPCATISGNVKPELYHRLLLKGIDLVSCDGSQSEPYYSFEYDPMMLPPRSSGAQDFFGYYNGQSVTANGGQLSIPLHTPLFGINLSPYGVVKTDNASYAMAGLLLNIKNAYGGKLSMGYAAHSLSTVINTPSDNSFLGRDANDGVRVSFMTYSDSYHPGKFTKQVFTYAGGQRFLAGGYFHYPLWTGNDNVLFCDNFISPHQLINGSNHGYSTVTVETMNEAGVSLSKKVIEYSNFLTNGVLSYYPGTKHYYQQPYTDKQYIKDWELGLPLTITEYAQNGLLKSKTINTYERAFDLTSCAGKLENKKKLNVVAGNGDIITLDAETYSPFTGYAHLSTTTLQKYTTNQHFITDMVSYGYDSHNNVNIVTTKNSRGVTGYISNIYNYVLSGPGITGGQPGVLYDLTANGIEKLVATERWEKDPPNGPSGDLLLDAFITRYSYSNDIILNQKTFQLQRLEPIKYSDYTGIVYPFGFAYNRILEAYNTSQTPADFQVLSEVLQTDGKGHATEMKLMDQDMYQSMLWDAGGNMVASVSNARLQDIGFTSFENAAYDDPNSYTGNEAIVNGRFSYKQSGVQYPADPVSGKAIYRLSPVSYIKSPELGAGREYTLTLWSKGGVPVVSGAGLGNIPLVEYYVLDDWKFYKATVRPNANGILTFGSTPFISVDEIRLFPVEGTMGNAVYEPMCGVSSETDATGRITYYEYDSFGRQVLVRNQERKILSKKEFHIGQ